jgi:membrane protease YdiL (CAAX protease family)
MGGKELIMESIRSYIRKHPVLWFYVLAFAFAWGGVLIVIGGPGAIPGSPAENETLLGPVMLAWFAGPSLSSVVLTALVDGKAGLRSLGSRLAKWRVGIHWYAVALLAGPLIDLLALGFFSFFYPGHLPKIVTSPDKLSVLIFGVVAGLVGGGFLEELGWTGFAIHHLRRRHSSVRTALIVGILWGAAHFSFVFWMSGSMIGSVPVAVFFFLRAIDVLLGGLPAFRVLMVWVYDRTGSLPVIMLMHAMLSASMLILGPDDISDVPFILFCLMSSAARWVVVAAVAGVRRLRRSELTSGTRARLTA